MRTTATLVAISFLGAGFLVSAPACAEEIRVTNKLNKWKLGETAVSPLPVPVKKGDVVEFRVTGEHGVVTLDKPGSDDTTLPKLDLVLTCGEEATAKPNHVLREVECGASSQFNKVLAGPMKLEVTDKFEKDVNFWCTEHQAGMWGTFKLAP